MPLTPSKSMLHMTKAQLAKKECVDGNRSVTVLGSSVVRQSQLLRSGNDRCLVVIIHNQSVRNIMG